MLAKRKELNKFTNILSLFCFILVCVLRSYGQENVHMRYIINSKQISNGDFCVYVDTLTLDTLFEDYSIEPWLILLKTKDNIELLRGALYGGMGTKCGCTPLPNGLWVKRYRNGHLKEMGEYDCNKKKGTWLYYHENGNLKIRETYKLPYLTPLVRYDFGNTKYLLNGLYSEYYENGVLKLEGKYVIAEEFSSIDTLLTVQSETHELLRTPIIGSFWNPKSIKIGIWKEMDEKQKRVKKENFQPFKDSNKKYRPIENR